MNRVRAFWLLPLTTVLLAACPQTVPNQGQFAGSGGASTGQDAAAVGGVDAAQDQLDATDAAPAAVDAQPEAVGSDSAVDSASKPDSTAASDDGAATAKDADACLCASDGDCASVALGTCQKAACTSCKCVVAAAADGVDCGAGKACQAGACQPKAGPGPWAKAIAAGGDTSCAIRPDGTAWCWGDNGQGQIGNGINSTDWVEPTPQAVVGLSAVDQIVLGSTHACALQVGGKVWCWGNNFNGKLGNGDSAGKSQSPVAVKGLTDALALAAGSETCFAVRNGATLWGWGSGAGDPFANGKFAAAHVPAQVQGGVLGVQKACAGYYHVCALALTGGKVTCWGRNPDGQVGNGKVGDGSGSEPPAIVEGLPAVVDLACGNYHSCAWDATGKVWCWGKNLASQLGQGGYSQAIPTAVAVKNLSDVQQLSGGQSHTCAVRKTGMVVCWGDNDAGEAGQANQGKDVDLPATVALPGKAKMVACGSDHSCALLEGGAVYCWGKGNDGQLGNGKKADSEAPVPVAGSVP